MDVSNDVDIADTEKLNGRAPSTETSNADEKNVTETATKTSDRREKKVSEESEAEEELLVVEEEADKDDEADDDELDDDEFIVEAIKSHLIDEDGVIRFQVKWEGYDKKSDLTWEPEENLTEAATDILNEYYEKVGGRDFILNNPPSKPKSKKRGRPSTTTSTPEPKSNGKKARKTERHPISTTPPASVAASYKPPSGNWEEDVQSIDACEGTDGKVQVYLQWKDGHKTQHPLETVYKRCPQKMLKFYEAHLVFKGGAGTPKESVTNEE